MEKTCQISRYGRILQEFLLEFFRNCCTANKLVKQKSVWTDDCQLAFDKVKLLLQKSPVLKSPDYEKPFKLHR